MTPLPSAPTSSSAPIKACSRPRRCRNRGEPFSRSVCCPASEKRRHRRKKLFRFFNRRNMPALIKADQLRPCNSRGVAFPGCDRQQFVLLPPCHQRWHLDTRQPIVQPFLFARRIPQKAPHRVAIVHCQLVRENLPQRIFSHPTRVIENRFHHTAHRCQRTRIQIGNQRILLQSCRVH